MTTKDLGRNCKDVEAICTQIALYFYVFKFLFYFRKTKLETTDNLSYVWLCRKYDRECQVVVP